MSIPNCFQSKFAALQPSSAWYISDSYILWCQPTPSVAGAHRSKSMNFTPLEEKQMLSNRTSIMRDSVCVVQNLHRFSHFCHILEHILNAAAWCLLDCGEDFESEVAEPDLAFFLHNYIRLRIISNAAVIFSRVVFQILLPIAHRTHHDGIVRVDLGCGTAWLLHNGSMLRSTGTSCNNPSTIARVCVRASESEVSTSPSGSSINAILNRQASQRATTFVTNRGGDIFGKVNPMTAETAGFMLRIRHKWLTQSAIVLSTELR